MHYCMYQYVKCLKYINYDITMKCYMNELGLYSTILNYLPTTRRSTVYKLIFSLDADDFYSCSY